MSKHWTHKLQARYFGGLVENGRRYATFTDWWRATDRSYYMLEMLAQMEYCDDRRIRLIACRFVREVKVDKDRTEWELLTDERCRDAVVVAERYTKGEVSSKELAESRRAAWNAVLTMKEGEAQNAAWGAVITASKAETLLTLLAASHGDDSQQHANIIREVIPAEEVAPLFERWAGEPT